MRKLPEDFAIDALAQEVERRKKLTGHSNYSYGKLIADTSIQEREKIVAEYRKKKRG